MLPPVFWKKLHKIGVAPFANFWWNSLNETTGSGRFFFFFFFKEILNYQHSFFLVIGPFKSSVSSWLSFEGVCLGDFVLLSSSSCPVHPQRLRPGALRCLGPKRGPGTGGNALNRSCRCPHGPLSMALTRAECFSPDTAGFRSGLPQAVPGPGESQPKNTPFREFAWRPMTSTTRPPGAQDSGNRSLARTWMQELGRLLEPRLRLELRLGRGQGQRC